MFACSIRGQERGGCDEVNTVLQRKPMPWSAARWVDSGILYGSLRLAQSLMLASSHLAQGSCETHIRLGPGRKEWTSVMRNVDYVWHFSHLAQSHNHEASPMTKVTHYVGLDVHKDSISIAVALEGRDRAEQLARIPNDPTRLLKKLDRLGPRSQLHVCYEAGPTGYGLFRQLEKAGVSCVIVAPSMIPKKSGDRVKTDKRDAAKLAHFLRSGDLTNVRVPDESTEALRDLVRARDDAKLVERAARHRLSKFLLRHDRKYSGRTAWTGMHLDWIRQQTFEHEAQNRVLREYLHSVDNATSQIARLTQDIEELVHEHELSPLVTSLQALKGFQLITAAGVAVEIGDLQRFHNPRQLMAYLGLVPSEHSTGEGKRRGGITKTGNKHVRRLLVEAAWSYRHPPKKSYAIKKRWEGLPPEIQSIAWKAQNRLHGRYRRLLGRGKSKQVVITALARELAGFVWAIGRELQKTAA